MIFAPMIFTILLFLLLLSVLVFVHELGHFLMARAMGMKVEEFGFGFPPKAFGIRKGGVLYSVNWIPIGGFVRIKGENGNDRDHQDSFASKKPWQRFLVLVAGVAMNFFLAAILFSAGFMMGLPAIIDSQLPTSAHVSEKQLSVMEVVVDSPAARAGIKAGDTITLIDNEVPADEEQARTYISQHGPSGIDVTIQHEDHTTESVRVTSEQLKGTDAVGIGVGFVQTGFVSYPFFLAMSHGVSTTIQMTGDIVRSFWDLLVGLVFARHVDAQLSGPVGIAVMTKEVAAMGFVYLLQFAAILSINLAVVNILPFPALDGGRILFLMIEKLRGKAVNQKFEVIANNLGFLVLMALVVMVTFQDVVKLFK